MTSRSAPDADSRRIGQFVIPGCFVFGIGAGLATGLATHSVLLGLLATMVALPFVLLFLTIVFALIGARHLNE